MVDFRMKLKILLVVQLAIVLLLNLFGCGDAGVSNGSIRGTVYSNRSGGALTKNPEPGVNVVASLEDGEPPIIRTTVSDANGQYVFTNIPVGKYVLGFDKDGFEPITTQAGTSQNQSAIGDQIRVYVESGATVTAPDANLNAEAPEGDGTVIVNLIDNVTGEPINGATVTVGTVATSNGSNGQYVLTVPVKTNNASVPGQALPFTVNAEGYTATGVDPSITGLAGQTVEKTFFLNPKAGTLEGTIQFANFEQLYTYDGVKITVDGVPQSYLTGGNGDCTGATNPDATGSWAICVPVRTDTNNRSYTLRFTHVAFFDQVVNNVLGPLAGSTRVEVPDLQPETVDIIGTVKNPDPDFPAVIKEAGLEGAVSGGAKTCPLGTLGTYTIQGVPTNFDLTVSVTVYTCDDQGQAPPESTVASTTFNAVNNGTGVYRVESISGDGGGN